MKVLDPLADSGDEDDDDDVEVTIGVIPPVNVQYSLLDIDAVPMLNDKPIYDIDLAQMEDRPWRKPGADITDYFNYGFTEDTWNAYCERQKKLRQEYGNQAAANKALFSSINLANPLGMPPTGAVKVLTDNGGKFKPHYHKLATDTSEVSAGVLLNRTKDAAFSFSRCSIWHRTSTMFRETLQSSNFRFNPSLPPPGMRPPQMAMPMTSMPPPGFNTMLPPPGFGQNRFSSSTPNS
ncbi:unnamed protein product [Haemonchus placei]|uniref:Pre-mRNA polyadenylation factor Fip1 domain-containing protein n=1 Tax=Haemonchus placei TaxID=6290 RepID=A0A3P7UKJ6_HAEPC|nr:unnamed protein product [Haemonchus placei]